ncbi:site-specific DNA-methyltransferase [Nonomuraea sp. NPDC048892]|uniref:site-specific DNA-methyltransferase n=1 Tax=Nonomuraea sp. NPDC048892 TaxID=3154624 RepID=UPI0033EB3F1D
MPPKKTSGPTAVESFTHEDKRTNLPTADSHDLLSEEAAGIAKLRYLRNPELDPQLVWKGKDTQDSEDLVVDAPPIYIQEKIDPRVLIENLRRTAQRPEDEPELTLFDTFDGLDGFEAIEYYQHQANWSNRVILGDSLQVMASLAEKESLRGKVQMIYIDPPYGIKFGSNFQPSTRNNKVKDGKSEDVTREVEQVKAFRDTWKLGISSYLAYLRDRLIVAHDLLTESGSVFVQIGDENVHLVHSLLDEVFGSENFVSLISFKTTSGAGSFAVGTNVLASVSSYIVWYARNIEQIKYRQLFKSKDRQSGGDEYTSIELPDGSRRKATAEELLNPGSGRLFRLDNMTSQTTRVGQTTVFPVEIDGKSITPATGGWKTNREGMSRLIFANRVVARKNSLGYVRYIDDFPAFPINSMWEDTVIAGRPGDKIYVVQTSSKVVERCMLMTTDPGDLVLDPTCGSGTTADTLDDRAMLMSRWRFFSSASVQRSLAFFWTSRLPAPDFRALEDPT